MVESSTATRTWPRPLNFAADHLRGHLVWALCAAIAGALVFWSYYLPLWSMRLVSPQYPKGIELQAYGTGMDGQLKEINTLNHFVGVAAIEPDEILEFKLFPYVIGTAHTLLFIGALMRNRLWRWLPRLFVIGVPVFFLADLQFWLYRFGHDLDPTAPLRFGTFTPKVIGETQLVQMHSETMVDIGFWAIVAGALLVSVVPSIIGFLAASWKNTGARSAALVGLIAIAVLVQALSGGSRPASAGGSIQAAIDAAAPGATVVIPPGTYREIVTVSRPVILVGEGDPIIEGDRVHDVVTIAADNVTLRGFVIQGSGRDVSTEPAGIRVKGNRATIEGNQLRDILYGIVLHGTGGHLVSGNTIESITAFDSDRRGHAIYLWNSADNRIVNNTVLLAKDGIFLSNSTRNHIEGNHVTGARYGIHYMYSNNNVFYNNTFRENVAGGAIMYSDGTILGDNEFAYASSPASGYGLLFKDVNDVEMRDNRIHHNRVGIIAEGAPLSPGRSFMASHNLIGYNEVGFDLSTTTDMTLTENTLVGNLRQVQTRGASLLARNKWSYEGRGNYWDDYRGYDQDGDGIGDLTYRNESLFHDMTEEHPAVRAFTFTPAQTALELAARWFPVYRPDPLAIDEHPLMSRTVGLDAAGGSFVLAPVLFSAMLVLVPAALVLGARRRMSPRWA